MDRIGKELAHHMAIDEGIFYPAASGCSVNRWNRARR